MPAPKGNQYAKGCKTSGRPGYDLDVEAKALDEWSKKPEAINLLGFTNERDYCAENLSVWAHKHKEFAKALKKAKERIALRREFWVNNERMNYGIYQRYQGMYDPLLHQYEREQKEFEAELKRKSEDDQTSTINVISRNSRINKIEKTPDH